MKRPAAKQARPKAKECSKKTKKAAVKKGRKPLGTLAEREARRKAVLKIVPAKLRKKFAKGCSGCRRRAYCTVSCWAKRGFIAEG